MHFNITGTYLTFLFYAVVKFKNFLLQYFKISLPYSFHSLVQVLKTNVALFYMTTPLHI